MLLLTIDFIIFFHFVIVIFITSLLVLIPLGYKLNWKLLQNKTVRKTHLGLMSFVTFEAIIGMTCPLTMVENYLSGMSQNETFISYWLGKVIYWNFPSIFFTIIYCLCLTWIILMWRIFTPKK